LDAAARIVEAVQSGRAEGQRLLLRGQASKRGWLAETDGEFLETLEHSGIVSYQPSELVVTVRCGTPLKDLIAELHQHGQALAFDPPQFFDGGSVGGMVSAGLSGPSRPWHGSTRDAVLGVEMVNGHGERLTFGGQVMKNVAGYDVSRLMAGACGSLGVVLQASLRVAPLLEHSVTLAFELDAQQANDKCRAAARTYLPLSGSWWADGRLFLRLAGTQAGVTAACAELGGEAVEPGKLWDEVRDHAASFFKASARQMAGASANRLWRVIVPPAAPMPDVAAADLAVEWGGGQRWLWQDDAAAVQAYARDHGGWAWALGESLQLEPTQQRLMSAIKAAFDPDGIFASPLALDHQHAH
jgi:glycolate oxidase FAD binding subunit